LYPFGRDAAPLVAEVKARKNGSGFTQLEKWFGEYQVLFLRRDRADPLVVLPWSTWESSARQGAALVRRQRDVSPLRQTGPSPVERISARPKAAL
jgi:hypothetical protein